MHKEIIIEMCFARCDCQSMDIVHRLEIINELHASDCRYHKDCYSKCLSYSPPKSSSLQSTECSSIVEAYSSLSKQNVDNWSRNWLIKRIKEHFDEQLICPSSPCLENMYVFRNHASKILAIKKDDGDYLSEAMNKVGKIIFSELLKAAKVIPDNIYKLGALGPVTMGQSSNTLNKLIVWG